MIPRLLALLLLFTCATRADEAPFEINDGDRVVFLGDALLEREGNYGFLETRMAMQFRDRRYTVRNLSWSGETPTGWARASFDPPAKGFERLKENLAMVKPTVVFLGFGMAASLQEMTDRSGDITLNGDPARYGAEPMSARRFKKELGDLMDALKALDPATEVRFVLLSPLRHEDLRPLRPGLPDPAAHNELLAEYTKVVAELAEERLARYVDLFNLWGGKNTALRTIVLDEIRDEISPNGIHLSPAGYAMLSEEIAASLGWLLEIPNDSAELANWQSTRNALSAAVRQRITRKNELFFHRFRPANSTYLFGFRKHEQGQNAAEIPQFDPLIAAEEEKIEALTKSGAPAVVAEAPAPAPTVKGEPPPHPGFQVADGYQIELWAENPLLEKPVQMNWDALGRLWVASSSLYPQIEPGGIANDKILILEDQDRDGKADGSTVFADDLLLPTAVVPDLVENRKADTGNRKEAQVGASSENLSGIRNPVSEISPSACYVGQSTELLHLTDTDGDGRADRTRIVFSGFGTEDTHHLIHTLRWGPDGRLYFNQSIYIHSHLETPWGMVRLNSGGVFAYDPRTERVEVYIKGFVNTWGIAWDQWGQSFHTDGAGFGGIAWGFPGAMFLSYEGARQILPTISPGNYPKFAGLELIQSPHFPAEWQGNAITCDFRAHRIVRFAIKDEGGRMKDEENSGAGGESAPANAPHPSASSLIPHPSSFPLSGYTATEQPDFIRTTDLSFRPIDVKLGPDGALYIADWSNPVINHGEVDFRDPRRDKHMGRIWRVTKKDAPLVEWEALVGKKTPVLLDRLLSASQWEKEQSKRVVIANGSTQDAHKWGASAESDKTRVRSALVDWAAKSDPARADALWGVARSIGFDYYHEGAAGRLFQAQAVFALLKDVDPRWRAIGIQYARRWLTEPVYNYDSDCEGIGSSSVMQIDELPRLIADSNSRARLEAMRAFSRIQTPRSAALVLEAALNQPGGEVGKVQSEAKGGTFDKAAFSDTKDPFYGYAAWLSINDLAQVWTEAIKSGEWQPDSPEKLRQLAWGLNAIRPELAGAALAKLHTDGKIPLDGSGPWIELLGTAGGPKELRALLDRVAAGQLSAEAEMRAALAFVEAARTRTIRPEGDLEAVLKNAAKPKDPSPALVAAGLRTLGLWKMESARELITGAAGAGETVPEVRTAAFEALRTLGGPAAVKALEEFSAPTQPLEIRQPAALNFARMQPGKGVPRAIEVLATLPEPAALEMWRGLLAINGAPNQIGKLLEKPEEAAKLPKPIVAAGVRAAREAGKNGKMLLTALSPLVGLSATETKTADYLDLAAQAKQQGDAVRGEFIYRRAALICTTCHAIGGAGGKVGPDMTSIGASAPLDYVIESLLDPAAKVKEGFNAVNVTLKDGTVVMGIQARESASEIVLRDATAREQTVAKGQIASTTNIGSLMPAGLLEQLQPRERLDLYAFLGELGKPGPFDASKGSVARVWTLAKPSTTPGTPDAALSMPVYTLVDGRLVKDLLAEKLPMFADANSLYATTRFQGPGGRTTLKIAGVKQAWLDGQPLDLAQEIALELSSGAHTLTVALDPKNPPEALRAESTEARFLGE
jgi:putative heme-binding domain-containing protein